MQETNLYRALAASFCSSTYYGCSTMQHSFLHWCLFWKFQGVFLNMKSMVHLQTPTGYIPHAPDSACSKQFSLKTGLFWVCGFGWNFLGFYLFKCFGLTCESADPVVCTASGPLTWGENEEEVRHTTRNRQTTSGGVFSVLGMWFSFQFQHPNTQEQRYT